MHVVMPLKPFAYKMHAKLKQKGFHYFCSPHHIGTLMKKLVHLLV